MLFVVCRVFVLAVFCCCFVVSCFFCDYIVCGYQMQKQKQKQMNLTTTQINDFLQNYVLLQNDNICRKWFRNEALDIGRLVVFPKSVTSSPMHP